MKAVFADTSYYQALFNPGDAYHSAALEYCRDSGHRVIVTEFVLLELGNSVSSSRRRALFPGFVRHLQIDPSTKVLPLSRGLYNQGLDLFERRADKAWSVTDCISFIVMAAHGLTEALSADHHFEQAGFTILLK